MDKKDATGTDYIKDGLNDLKKCEMRKEVLTATELICVLTRSQWKRKKVIKKN